MARDNTPAWPGCPLPLTASQPDRHLAGTFKLRCTSLYLHCMWAQQLSVVVRALNLGSRGEVRTQLCCTHTLCCDTFLYRYINSAVTARWFCLEGMNRDCYERFVNSLSLNLHVDWNHTVATLVALCSVLYSAACTTSLERMRVYFGCNVLSANLHLNNLWLLTRY